MRHVLAEEHTEIPFHADGIVLKEEQIAMNRIGPDFLITADDIVKVAQMSGGPRLAPEARIQRCIVFVEKTEKLALSFDQLAPALVELLHNGRPDDPIAIDQRLS